MIDPNNYWVNNPLITPVNKALMYDNDIDRAKYDERERIIEFLKDKCECTERMLADAWSPQGQTLFCKWHKLIHEIKGDNK